VQLRIPEIEELQKLFMIAAARIEIHGVGDGLRNAKLRSRWPPIRRGREGVTN
jgi:hypothetical protein